MRKSRRNQVHDLRTPGDDLMMGEMKHDPPKTLKRVATGQIAYPNLPTGVIAVTIRFDRHPVPRVREIDSGDEATARQDRVLPFREWKPSGCYEPK
ncbi:MAG: hypothetical protein M3346_08355 [Actinomycetota bacterium]|nr:hypothetical protein [Actinomycetota bacterium]